MKKNQFMLAFIFYFQSYAQDLIKINSFKYDASHNVPYFTSDENYSTKLEFRKSAKKNKFYKVSVNLSVTYNDFSFLKKTSVDTILIERIFFDYNDKTYFQIGLDKTFEKNKLFIIGSDFIFEYELSSRDYL